MTEKRKKAAALRYNQHQDAAPVLVASGKGLVAEEIMKRAQEHKVPIVEDATLVELLSELDINETIPEQLFEMVAEVFAFIYQLDKSAGTSMKE